MGITQSQLEQLYRQSGHKSPNQATKDKVSKLKNIRKVVDGISFQSSIEARAYQILKLWERAGAISDLRMQPAFTLQERFRDNSGRTIRAITYSADFRFFDNATRKLRFVDAKGMVTQAFKKSIKMLKDKHPDVDIEIWDKTRIQELSRC